MKNRMNLGCRIKGTRERGAWAELYFMVLAMGQGLLVSSPYGGLGPYDVGVEGTGRILRVQVKCTLYQCQTGSYCMSVNMKKGFKGRRGYPAGTVDFFAIYIIPTDDWYIIPYDVVGDKDANLFFKPGCEKQKYGEYKEAWHLLVEEANRPAGSGIEIQACCGEFSEEGSRVTEEVFRALVFFVWCLLCLCAAAVKALAAFCAWLTLHGRGEGDSFASLRTGSSAREAERALSG